jgi:capsular exopolysaccharide synthesis family protein
VLAWVPKIAELNGRSTNGDELVIENNPDSIPSETIRALRTRVQFSRVDRENLKTILITSPAPQEGKSTIAINLAGSFAHSNKRTLIIDADLRKPRLHQVFKKERTPGLIDYLFGDVSFDQLIQKTEIKNLSLVTAGTLAHNPSEILDSPQMELLLTKVRNEFDYVIIDSPPIVAVTDAEILARKVDGSILVVSFNKTDKGLLERGVHLLKNDHSYLIGSVLNNFSTTSGYGSYYKYYYYYSPKGEKKKKHHSEGAS